MNISHIFLPNYISLHKFKTVKKKSVQTLKNKINDTSITLSIRPFVKKKDKNTSKLTHQNYFIEMSCPPPIIKLSN